MEYFVSEKFFCFLSASGMSLVPSAVSMSYRIMSSFDHIKCQPKLSLVRDQFHVDFHYVTDVSSTFGLNKLCSFHFPAGIPALFQPHTHRSAERERAQHEAGHVYKTRRRLLIKINILDVF